jgi:hypothetical protein
MLEARSLEEGLHDYAAHHQGSYPDGASSTEVFQKLLDENYVSDPSIFFIPLPGKIPPVPNTKLKPENICWDVTSGVSAGSPAKLPVVYLTGYKVTYAPGASAVALMKPYPLYGVVSGALKTRTWKEWWDGAPEPFQPGSSERGIAVAYKDGYALFMRLDQSSSDTGTGTISNFVPPDFKPDGHVYRQLTPDGVAP